MFILRDLLHPLQAHFSDTDLGRERFSLFAYTLLAVIVPFTSSMTSNLLCSFTKAFHSAKATINGIETAHMIRKGQPSDENIPAYKQFKALAG